MGGEGAVRAPHGKEKMNGGGETAGAPLNLALPLFQWAKRATARPPTPNHGAPNATAPLIDLVDGTLLLK